MEGIRLTYSKTVGNETFTAMSEVEHKHWANDAFSELKEVVTEQVEQAEAEREQEAINQLEKDQQWFDSEGREWCVKPPHTVFEQQNREKHGMEEYE
jgi:hypothetical protein